MYKKKIHYRARYVSINDHHTLAFSMPL